MPSKRTVKYFEIFNDTVCLCPATNIYIYIYKSYITLKWLVVEAVKCCQSISNESRNGKQQKSFEVSL